MWFRNAGAPSTAKYPGVFGKLSDPNVTCWVFFITTSCFGTFGVYKWLCIDWTECIYWLQFLGWQNCIFSHLKIMRWVGSSVDCSGSKIFVKNSWVLKDYDISRLECICWQHFLKAAALNTLYSLNGNNVLSKSNYFNHQDTLDSPQSSILEILEKEIWFGANLK